MKLKTIIESWNVFFFKPQTAHSVALLRIALGFILLLNWYSIWHNLDLFWGPESILSLDTAVKYSQPLRLNLFEFLPGDERTPIFIAGLHLFGVLGMIFGFCTRLSIAVTFFTLLSFHNRNIFILNSGDMVLRNFLFLLFWAPSGDLFSIDYLIRKWRGQAVNTLKQPWALRLMQIQFCLIYIATVLFKVKGNWWADGTAVYIATRLDEFVRTPLEILNNMYMLKFMTWSTLLVELALGTLIWIKELRYWVLLSGIALHLGIELTMTIPLFEWIMIAAMISMVESKDIDLLLRRFKETMKQRHKSGVAV